MLYYMTNTIILLLNISQNTSIFQRISEVRDMFTFLINSQFIHILIVVLLYSQPEKLKSNSQKIKFIIILKKYSYFNKNYSRHHFGRISIKF